MEERVKKIHALTKQPLTDDSAIKRVEIVVLKYKEEADVIGKCLDRIINHTDWPFKLNVYDNRPNNANTAKIWNRLFKESTCDYILYIDSDAFIPRDNDPCWLTRMMDSVILDGAQIVVPMGDNVGGSNKAEAAQPYPSSQPQWGIWSGFCFLLDRKPWLAKKLYPFDDNFYIYGQDSEFAFRSQKMGLKCVYRTDVFVQHLGSYSFNKANEAGEVDREADKQYAASLYRLKTQGKIK